MDQDTLAAVIGIDVGGTKLLLRYRDTCLRHATGPGFGGADLTAVVRAFIDAQHAPPCAIGVAVPGLVESNTVAACDVLPGLVGWRPDDALGGRIAAGIVVNDAKAALHATTRDLPPGATAVTVMAGTAIGCGIVAGGAPLGGASGWAGELGYWPVRSADGQWRRLDELAGGRYMADLLGVDGAALASRAAQGDPAACAIVREGGAALGGALAGVLNLLNPDYLTVGGGALRVAGYWPAALARLQASSLPAMLAACVIRTVHQREDVVAIGAAAMAMAAQG